ncbi:MAG: hypothetical protein AB8E15_00185 [Bdellovibrionales bacterium]
MCLKLFLIPLVSFYSLLVVAVSEPTTFSMENLALECPMEESCRVFDFQGIVNKTREFTANVCEDQEKENQFQIHQIQFDFTQTNPVVRFQLGMMDPDGNFKTVFFLSSEADLSKTAGLILQPETSLLVSRMANFKDGQWVPCK